MAVVCQAAPNCFLIDHLKYINDVYASCLQEDELVKVKFRDVFFDIKCPFQLESQAYKNSVQLDKHEDMTLDEAINMSRKKRKRKKLKLEEQKADLAAKYKEVDDILKSALDTLLQSKEKVYFEASPSSADVLSNNASARAASRMVDRDQMHIDVCIQMTAQEYQEVVITSNMSTHIDSLRQIVNCVVTYDDTNPAIIPIGSKKYLVPPRCSFLLSDVQSLPLLNHKKEQYDMILLDPPWLNKSVKRKKGYNLLSEDDLELLPVPSLAAEGCLVGVWITNNTRQKEVVKDRLFQRWGVEFCAEWHWLKLTKSGQPVIHMDSTQKKPYEHLLLGRIRAKEDMECVPDHLVFASIPSSIHSHKPPLTELLTKYLPPQNRCLELFARSLVPGWTSWGNEVLKLQQLDYYKVDLPAHEETSVHST